MDNRKAIICNFRKVTYVIESDTISVIDEISFAGYSITIKKQVQGGFQDE